MAPAKHIEAGIGGVALGLAVAASLILAGVAPATGPSTITFSEHPAGTVIDTQYASEGVRFGKAADFGVALAGAWDCGAPIVKALTSDGNPPKIAQAPVCGGRSGTIVAFAHPRRSIRLLVDATPSTDRGVEVKAYDSAGGLLAGFEAVASRRTVAIDRPSPDVRFLAVQLEGEGTSAVLFDDLVFDHLGDPLTLLPRNVGATVGVERTDNVAFLTDADPTATASDYAAWIDWGDGRSADGRVVRSGAGYDVLGTHTYQATGTFTVRTTVEKVNGVRATTTSTARVVDRPDFTVSVTPGSASVSQGQGARFTVAVAPLAGFTGQIRLELSGALGSFSPGTIAVPGTSQLTVSTSRATAVGSYPLTIRATSGELSRTASATLAVTRAGATVVAKLAVSSPRPASALVVLDARGTTGASRYEWDLDGDARPDVTCGRSTPVLGTRLRGTGRRTVSLRAVALDGSATVVRRTIGARDRAGLSGAAAGRVPEIATCLRDATDYLQGVACAEKVVFGIVEAKGCFTRARSRDDVPAPERVAYDEYYSRQGISAAGQARCESGASCPDPLARDGALDVLVSRGPVRLNGIDFFPGRDASIVLFPQIQRVVSSRAEVALGGIRVRSAAAVNLPLSGGIVRPSIGKRFVRVPLFGFEASTSLPQLGGFRLAGRAELSLVKRAGRYLSEARVNVAVPAVFSLFGGSPPTGATRLEADNDRGLVLDELSVRVPEAHLGAVRMTDLAFEYRAKGNPQFRCLRHWWKATANVFLGGSPTGGGGFRLAPDPPQNGVAFCNGTLKSAGGEVLFDPPLPQPQIFPGVFLRRIGFGIELDPTVLVGSGTITAGKISEVTGSLLMAFPSPAAPYVVKRGDANGLLARLVGRVFVSPTIAVGGTFGVRVTNQLTLPFGDSFLAYSYPDFVAVGGSVRVPLPGMSLTAGVNGDLAVGSALFSFHGFGEACIAGLTCILRADAWVTSTGVVACGTIAGELHPGAGYRWGDLWPTIWLVDGCKPSRYWVNVRPRVSGRSVGATATATFTVARGERMKNVRLDGLGGAPRIEVRGPSGELVTTSGGDLATGRTIRVLRQDGGGVTWIGVENAVPGTYTVTTLPGSVGIAGLAATRARNEHLRASVTRKGSSRALRYDVARVPGRRVTFFERGRSSYRRLGSVTGGKGRIGFIPAPGASGLRQIVARVEIDGVPAPDRVVARYRLAPPARLTRPTDLRVRRSGTTVIASWGRVGDARAYGVVVRVRDGQRRVVRVSSGRRIVRLSAIARTQSGTVEVRALGHAGAWSAAASDRFPALRKQPSAFRSYAELGRRR